MSGTCGAAHNTKNGRGCPLIFKGSQYCNWSSSAETRWFIRRAAKLEEQNCGNGVTRDGAGGNCPLQPVTLLVSLLQSLHEKSIVASMRLNRGKLTTTVAGGQRTDMRFKRPLRRARSSGGVPDGRSALYSSSLTVPPSPPILASPISSSSSCSRPPPSPLQVRCARLRALP